MLMREPRASARVRDHALRPRASIGRLSSHAKELFFGRMPSHSGDDGTQQQQQQQQQQKQRQRTRRQRCAASASLLHTQELPRATPVHTASLPATEPLPALGATVATAASDSAFSVGSGVSVQARIAHGSELPALQTLTASGLASLSIVSLTNGDACPRAGTPVSRRQSVPAATAAAAAPAAAPASVLRVPRIDSCTLRGDADTAHLSYAYSAPGLECGAPAGVQLEASAALSRVASSHASVRRLAHWHSTMSGARAALRGGALASTSPAARAHQSRRPASPVAAPDGPAPPLAIALRVKAVYGVTWPLAGSVAAHVVDALRRPAATWLRGAALHADLRAAAQLNCWCAEPVGGTLARAVRAVLPQRCRVDGADARPLAEVLGVRALVHTAALSERDPALPRATACADCGACLCQRATRAAAIAWLHGAGRALLGMATLRLAGRLRRLPAARCTHVLDVVALVPHVPRLPGARELTVVPRADALRIAERLAQVGLLQHSPAAPAVALACRVAGIAGVASAEVGGARFVVDMRLFASPTAAALAEQYVSYDDAARSEYDLCTAMPRADRAFAGAAEALGVPSTCALVDEAEPFVTSALRRCMLDVVQ